MCWAWACTSPGQASQECLLTSTLTPTPRLSVSSPQSLLVGSKTKSIPSYLPEPMGKVQDDVVGAQRRQQLAGYPHVFENFILKAPENALNVVTVPLCWLVIVIPVTWFPPTPLFLKECIIFSHRSFHRLTLSLCFVCLFLLPPPLSGSLLLLID